MDNILKVASRVLTVLECECYTDDCDGTVVHEDDTLSIVANRDDNQWMCELRTKGDESHQDVKCALICLFGPPDCEHSRSDLPEGVKVNNWKVDNVLIVQLNGSMEFFENYTTVRTSWSPRGSVNHGGIMVRSDHVPSNRRRPTQ